MTVDIAALTTRRGTIKGRITRFLKYAQDFPQDGDISQIRIRKVKIEENWEEFQNIESIIEANVTEPTGITAEENYRFEFEDLYFNAIVEGKKIITNQNATSEAKSESTAGSHQPSVVADFCYYIGYYIYFCGSMLAALNVPEFSGNYKEWSTFNDMFSALIHSNEALTQVQKFFFT
jgi:hypothetical protein